MSNKKIVFMAGGAGSGKGFAIKNFMQDCRNLKYEMLMSGRRLLSSLKENKMETKKNIHLKVYRLYVIANKERCV